MKALRLLPGSAWLGWLRNLALRVGVLTGVYLSTVMVISLLAANRVRFLEPFAAMRNAVSVVAFALVMLIPIGCFLRSSARLFASGMAGWFLFTLAYWVMGIFFERLHARFPTPFHAFMLGAALYTVVALMAWVASMALDARHHPIAASRRRPY